MVSNGHKTATPGAGVVLLCFFLPWILVSCGGQPVAHLSGWQLAAGTTVGEGYSAQQLPGTPILFLALFAAIAVLGVVFFAMQRGHSTRTDSFALIGLGVLPLLVMFSQVSSMQARAAQQGITVEFQYGYWGVVLGYIAVIVGGGWDIVSQPDKT